MPSRGAQESVLPNLGPSPSTSAIGAAPSSSSVSAAGAGASSSSPRPSISFEGETSDSDKQRSISKEIEEARHRPLRVASRRPSVPTDASRLQQLELSIAQQGWLIKHSRGGAANHHRRWFILIGGSLYYARSSVGSNATGATDSALGPLQIFAELEHAQGVEMVDMDGFPNAFRISFTDAAPMLFATLSAADRLKWLAALEAHMGMQPVPLQVLQRQLKREEEDGTAALRVTTLSAELADSEAEVQRLRELVGQLQAALTEKDEQLWRLVAERDPSVINTLTGRAEPPLARQASQPTGKNRSIFMFGTREPKTPQSRAPELVAEGSAPSIANGPSPVPKLELTAGRLQAFDAPVGAPGPLSDRSDKAPSDGSSSRSFKGRFFPRKKGAATERTAPAPASGPPAPSQGGFRVAQQPQSAPQPPMLTGMSSTSMSAVSSNSFASFGGTSHAGTAFGGTSHGGTAYGGTSHGGTLHGGTRAQPREYAMSDRSYAPSERNERGRRAGGGSQLTVRRYGHLTKLSRGGFTVNWNRRAFVLIGSTLFYEKDYDTLAVTPKVFAQLNPYCEIVSWAVGNSPHNHVFAIKYPPQGDAEQEVLQLAADTAIDKFAWMEAISGSLNEPHCPVGRVATLMAILALESTQRSVLQSQIEDAMMQAGAAPGATSYRGSCRSHTSAKSGVAAAPDLLQRSQQQRPDRDNSPGMSWFLDKVVPDIFKNL